MNFIAAAPGNVTLTVVNDALGAPTVYVGTAATLDVTLQTDTGSDVTLSSQTPASTLLIFPPAFYTNDEIAAMTIVQPDWTLAHLTGALQLTFTGTNGTAWKAGTALAFSIGTALSNASPTSSPLQINPSNMSGSVPVQLQTQLSLIAAPQPGNPKLTDVLQLSLDDQGTVYVSQTGDPLQNVLTLNVKNVGSAPLYAGGAMWTGSPTVTVTFVYGSTPGSLAPDDDAAHPNVGSAWNIKAAVSSTADPWTPTNPTSGTAGTHPSWLLQPSPTNQEIIGVGDAANATFTFSDVISFTRPAHTQMTVQFSGFMQNEKTPYDDAVFVLDIVKLMPPPTRGLVNFSGRDPIVQVYDITIPVEAQLHWTMFDVASVILLTGVPGVPISTVPYPDPKPLAQDSTTQSFLPPAQSTPVTFTLQAYDGNAAYLNSLQYTIFVQSWIFLDPRDGKIYPTMLVGNTIWMKANFDYAAAGSEFYNDDPGNEPTYGRLYTAAAAQSAVPQGWRIPSDADWAALLAAYGSSYAALIAGGTSGFGAQLGGYDAGGGQFNDLAARGYYWSSTQALGGNVDYVQFSSVSQSISTGISFPPTNALSLRLIRNV